MPNEGMPQFRKITDKEKEAIKNLKEVGLPEEEREAEQQRRNGQVEAMRNDLKRKFDAGERLLPREIDELRTWAQGHLPEEEQRVFIEKLYGIKK